MSAIAASSSTFLGFSSPPMTLEAAGFKRKTPSTPFDEITSSPEKIQRADNAQDLSPELREKIEAREVVDPASCPMIRRCPLTGCGERNLEIAHIIPVKLNGTSECYLEFYGIFIMLELIWGVDQAKKWSDLLMKDGKIDTQFAGNLIALNVHARNYWDSAQITFKPLCINAAKTEMLLSFH
ncbi:unnamed protein product [Penicillium salamii]|nr:unnamed protein product [Penicillium salamii]